MNIVKPAIFVLFIALAGIARGQEHQPRSAGAPNAGDSAAAAEARQVDSLAQTESVAPPSSQVLEFAGTLQEKPWSKSLESYYAGGSEYFILELPDSASSNAPVFSLGDRSKVLIRPSHAVPIDELRRFRNQRVKVRCVALAQEKSTVSDMSQHPLGEPSAYSGGGCGVAEIRPIK